MPLFDSGHIKNWLIDVYYGRKLNLPPTTGGTGNILLTLGKASTDELIRNVKNGIFITNFLGGNVNSATGAFSLGIYGQQIENGTLTKPVAEMNMADNHLTLWHKLVAVGSEPYRYSSYQLPALVFENIALSGL